MRLPTIHLNGSDGKQLLEQYMAALEKTQEALQALSMIDVNGRDYYVNGGDAIRDAMHEHAVRVAKLRSVTDELSKIAEHIDEQLAP